MLTYLTLEIITLIIPLFFITDKNLGFYKKLKPVIISILIVASIFILWDIIFTKRGVWGFNSQYHIPFKPFGLPIEEWLFFLIIPYSSIFLHETAIYLFPKVKLSRASVIVISTLLILSSCLIMITNFDKAYTTVNCMVLIAIVLIVLLFDKELLKQFYLSFLVILVPFIIVNGILTGSFIPEEVVWYNPSEILGICIFTIPIEDFGFAFSLILSNLLLIKLLNRKKQPLNE